MGTDASAVMALPTPESQQSACPRVQISIAWVKPQELMNMPKHRNIQLNGKSHLRRIR